MKLLHYLWVSICACQLACISSTFHKLNKVSKGCVVSKLCVFPTFPPSYGENGIYLAKVSLLNMAFCFFFEPVKKVMINRPRASSSVNLIPNTSFDSHVGKNKYLWIVLRAFNQISVLLLAEL